MEVHWYLWAYNFTNTNDIYVFCLSKNNMTHAGLSEV